MTTKTVTLYTFDELSEAAKERAREWWRECEAQDFGGFDELNEPIETAARLLGISLKTRSIPLMSGKTREESCIWWTLHVQGAGASFDGTYSYAKGAVKAIKAEFPTDTVLHSIARDLQALERKYFYRPTALIRSDSRYHALDVEVDSEAEADQEAFKECFERFAHWIYKLIDAEYEYRMSDENVDEAMRANEYTFTEEGKRED